MQHLSVRLAAAVATFLIGISVTTLPNGFRFYTNTGDQVEQEVLAVERQYIQAHLQRDTSTLEDILASEFTINLPYGRFTTKSERLELLAQDDFSFMSFDTDGVAVRVFNDHEAMVTGHAVLEGRNRDGQYVRRSYNFTRAYEKRQGRWQIVTVQISRRF